MCAFIKWVFKICLLYLLNNIFLNCKTNVENLEDKANKKKTEKEHISLHKSMIISLPKFPGDLGQLVYQ